jgi:UDP-N-acetyl-D-galactosamine dehydrogenase
LRIGVIGLGYVGLPVALAFARRFPGTVGFDINEAKLQDLRQGKDRNGEVSSTELMATALKLTSLASDLRHCTFFVVAVPTPLDWNRNPDLTALVRASELVGGVLKAGDTVVFESTVYPGVTEEVCGPALARASGLRQGVDFKLGYSPERINPGDTEHTLECITKVVSGQDAETLELVATAYGTIITAGIHRAPSIKVAEAAKVIENTQRDINIALMNELALVFDRMGIETRDVLAAARTKWNFLPFMPGLVGGHCIGVDPYYLTSKAEELGFHPEVILAGRRTNDNMGIFIAQKTVKLLIGQGCTVRGARVGVLGLTFKENVRDLRNSRVPDIVEELKSFGVDPLVCDPLVDPSEAQEEYGIKTCDLQDLVDLDALVLAVAHKTFLDLGSVDLANRVKSGGVLVDVKAAIPIGDLPNSLRAWSL